jgi:hypothetical protein
MKDYWLQLNALGFGKETKLGYFRKIIDYGCAYVCAPHLVQIKMNSLLDNCMGNESEVSDNHNCMYRHGEVFRVFIPYL